MKKTIIFVFFALTITGLLFAVGKSEASPDSRPVAAVSILPQKYFLERIAGDTINVHVMVLPGESPATYEPTPDQIRALTKASVFFTIGVPFERSFVPKIKSTLKDLRVIDTSEGIEKMDMQGTTSRDDTVKDPHIWMSPPLVKIQAAVMLKTLVQLFPERKELFEQNCSTFINDLNRVDEDLGESLAPLKGTTLFVYHPSFGYFARRYGLKQKAIETGGKAPGPKTLNKLVEEVKGEGVKVIFVQPEFQQHSVEVIAEAAGTAVIPIDPLAEDYLNNLEAIAETLKNSLR